MTIQEAEKEQWRGFRCGLLLTAFLCAVTGLTTWGITQENCEFREHQKAIDANVGRYVVDPYKGGMARFEYGK